MFVFGIPTIFNHERHEAHEEDEGHEDESATKDTKATKTERSTDRRRRSRDVRAARTQTSSNDPVRFEFQVFVFFVSFVVESS